MAFLDDLRNLAEKLPAEVKPVAAEVVDVVAAVVHTLESAGLKVPHAVDQATAAAESITDQGEPVHTDETEGSAVFDVAPAADAPPPPTEPVESVAPADPVDLEAQIREASDHLQSLQVQLADQQKTQHESL